MKIYTLKLKTASTTNYSLYDGTTLVSDSNLTTLFATEGEAYFTIDLNSLTPTNLTSLTIVNSSDTAVMTNTGLTLVEGKNFKGEWGNSATSFTSFAQLPAYGLDESQLSALVSKMGEGKIREIDVSYATTGTDNVILGGIVRDGEIVILRSSDTRTKRVFWANTGVNPYSGWNPGYGYMALVVRIGYSALFVKPISGATSLEWVENYSIRSVPRDVIDNLTSTNTGFALSANQGKVLKGLIDSLVIKGSGAPTTSTVGTVGMLYEDTTNGKLYQCTDATNPYVWEEVGGGGIPTDATFWGKSYDSTNNKVGDGDNIAIGTDSYVVSNKNTQVVVGSGARSTAGNGAVVIGANATASNDMVLVIGRGASTGATWATTVGPNSSVGNEASYGVALGSYSVASRGYEVSIGSGGAGQNYATRYLANVRDPELPQDAATKNYVDHSHTIAASAPDNTTVGVLGQLYTDTTGMHTYQCTAIDDTDPSNVIYTWTQRW